MPRLELLEDRTVPAITLGPGDNLVADNNALGGQGAILRAPGSMFMFQDILASGGSFSDPGGLAVAANGDLFVADPSADGGTGAIFRVHPGTGAQSIVSSGGHFVEPVDLVIDADGSLLVVDSAAEGGNGAVIRVNPATGAQSVVSKGQHFVDPFGLALEAGGSIVVADVNAFMGTGGVIRVNPATGEQTPVSSGGNFVDPQGIVVRDNGLLLVADVNAFMGNPGGVIQVDPVTGDQSVFLSPNAGFFSEPSGLALDLSGNVIVADNASLNGQGAIIFGNATTGDQFVLSSGGFFDAPYRVTVVDSLIHFMDAPDGGSARLVRRGDFLELFNEFGFLGSFPLASTRSVVIRGGDAQDDSFTVDFSGGLFTLPDGIHFDGGEDGFDQIRVVGNGLTRGTYAPSATTPGDGTLTVTDGTQTVAISFIGLEPAFVSNMAAFTLTTPNNADQLFIDSPAPGQTTVSGTSGGIPFESLTFSAIIHFTLDAAANDGATPDDTVVVGGSGVLAAGLQSLTVITGAGSDALTVPADSFRLSGSVVVSNEFASEVQRHDGFTGSFIDDVVPSGSGGLSVPSGLAYGPDGRLYVASRGTDSVLRYDATTGAFVDAFVASGAGGLAAPDGLVFGPDGNLYVVSQTTDSVLRYNGTTGAFLNTFVAAGSGGLDEPYALLFGPDGHLYVGSRGTDSVLRYNGTTGAFVGPFAAGGALDSPRGIAFGPDGHLYVSSGNTADVKRYDGTTGTFVDTFVSPGSGGLSQPTGLLFDRDGNLLVADFDTSRVLLFDGTDGDFIDYYIDFFGGLISPTFLLPSPTPEFRFDGGTGSDRVLAGADADLTLANGSLSSSAGGAVLLSGVEAARLTGGPGDNLLDASGFTLGPVTLDGGAGDDTVTGGTGNDSLDGGPGVDLVRVTGNGSFTLTDTSLTSSAGTDVLAGIEQASLTGGTGADLFTVSGWTGQGTLTGGPGIDRVVSANDAHFLLTDLALTRFSGGTFSLSGIEEASLTGGPGANTLDAGFFSGSTSLTGGDGDDSLVGGSGPDVLAGGVGDDVLRAGAGNDLLTGDVGDDHLEGNAGADTVTGGAGADTSLGGAGLDRLVEAGDANMTLTNGALVGGTALGTDVLGSIDQADLTVTGTTGRVLSAKLFTGAVSLTGGTGNDKLTGGLGGDALRGGAGIDKLTGNAGDDVMTGGAGNDVLNGGLGVDKVLDAGDTAMTLTATQLKGGAALGTDSLVGIELGDLTITGSTGRQLSAAAFKGRVTLTGGSGNDTLLGGKASDVLSAGLGTDRLNGGKGNDSLDGGAGIDSLDGGAGIDQNLGALDGDSIVNIP